jgi:hypothetical protein
MLFRQLKSLLLGLSIGVVLTACGPGYLDVDKKVLATEPNREVFDVLKTYHSAMENKDMEAVKNLVSANYHENGGTTDDPSDDYGYDKLMQRLQMLRDNVKKVQLRIKLRDIAVTGDHATVQFDYLGRVLLSEGGVDRYKTFEEPKEMELQREAGQWKIIAGL